MQYLKFCWPLAAALALLSTPAFAQDLNVFDQLAAAVESAAF